MEAPYSHPKPTPLTKMWHRKYHNLRKKCDEIRKQLLKADPQLTVPKCS